MIGKKNKAAFLFLIIITIFIGSTSKVIAKDPEFLLDIDTLNLQKGKSTNLMLTLKNAQGAKLSQINGLENFDVLSSNQSTSTQIINGDISYQTDIRYIIMPKSTGKFTLEGIVEYKGKAYQTNLLNINVSEAKDLPQEEVSDLFVKTIISDNEVYLGQKVILAYELYSRYNIENCGFRDTIEIDGFMQNDVPKDNLKAEYVELEGKRYVKYEARQTYLTPIKVGTFNIPEYNFQANISTGGGFFSSSQAEYLKTEATQIIVKPLPENKPADFSGIVGKLDLQSEYSRLEVPFGDSLTLKVSASGNCDLSVLDKITSNGISNFTVYETEKSMQENIIGNQYWSKRDYEIILVPEKSGEVKIDPIYISYFDTESGTYKQAEIPGATITVTGSAPQAQAQVQNQGGNIAYEEVIIDRINYSPNNDGYLTLQLKLSHIFIVLIALIAIALLVILVVFLPKVYRRQDKKLAEMFRQVNNASDKNGIYNILNNMIKYRFNFSIKASSKDLIKTKLTKYEISNTVIEIMDYLETDKANSDEGVSYLKGKMKEVYLGLSKV